MAERPPVASHNYLVSMTENDQGARAVGLALVSISYQLDRIIELLEDTEKEGEHGNQPDEQAHA